MQVHEVMTKNVKIVSPTETIDKAASLMGEIDCDALPVGENDQLVGMITDRDITLRAVAKGQYRHSVLCARPCRLTLSRSLRTKRPRPQPKI